MIDHGGAPRGGQVVGVRGVGHRVQEEVEQFRPGRGQRGRPDGLGEGTLHGDQQRIARREVVPALDAVLAVVAAELAEETEDPALVVDVVDDELQCLEQAVTLLIQRSREEGAEFGVFGEQGGVERGGEPVASVFGGHDRRKAGAQTRNHERIEAISCQASPAPCLLIRTPAF